MVEHVSRRTFLAGTAGAGALALAGCLTTTNEGYEVWALDQGTDSIYIYEAHSEPEEDDTEFEQADTIDTATSDGFGPKTVQFSSEYDYAAVACLPETGRSSIKQAINASSRPSKLARTRSSLGLHPPTTLSSPTLLARTRSCG